MSQPWFTQLPNGIKNSHREGQKTHEEMLNITNYYGNTIKTAMSYHLTPIRIAINNLTVLISGFYNTDTFILKSGHFTES